MKYLIRTTQVSNRAKLLVKDFGFTVKTDTVSMSDPKVVMFTTLDDVTMIACHYNKVNEEKTASHIYFNIEYTHEANYIIGMIAGAFSFKPNKTIVKYTQVSNTMGFGDVYKKEFLALFTKENGYGRNFRVNFDGIGSIRFGKEFDKVPKVQMKANMIAYHLNLCPWDEPDEEEDDDGNIVTYEREEHDEECTRDISSLNASIFLVDHMDEVLGCTIDEFIIAMKEFDATSAMKAYIDSGYDLDKFMHDKNLFGLGENGHLLNYDYDQGSLRYISLRGSKSTILLKEETFMAAIDLSNNIFWNILRKLGMKDQRGCHCSPFSSWLNISAHSSGSIIQYQQFSNCLDFNYPNYNFKTRKYEES